MAFTKQPKLTLFLLFTFIYAAQVSQGVAGSRNRVIISHPLKLNLRTSSEGHVQMQDESYNLRRMMIGSVAPTCTYNECRRCKYRCRAEQVPVEGNDPMNSAYHYRCVCHR